MHINVRIFNNKIGEGESIFIIAEAGVCHDGDVEKAKKLIDIAKDAGVDAVKFQTWITEELCLKDTKKASYQEEQTGVNESQFDMIKKLELSYSDFIELKKYCDDKKIMFLSTPDEEKSAKFLVNDLEVPTIKIGSGELNNLSYIKFLASFGKPLVVSTGMGDIKEIQEAKKIIYDQGNKDVVFLHCTTDYPTRYEDVNLNAMLTMKNELNTLFGYSDHTIGLPVTLVAVALGAQLIEKHYTYDRLAYGPDHKASLSPDQLKEMVQEIRKMEKLSLDEREKYVKKLIGVKFWDLITGSFEKKPCEREVKIKPVVQKSVVLRGPLSAGSVLKEEDLVMKRADARGITADKYMDVVGKKLKQDLDKDQLVSFDILE
ncbi:N-acetylneuraminate synthase [Candidatus Woesearchaeota archaeon]|jgi:N,N'-diacetyllegionaminate synthase|nr:N-acetylneuraminate synthase [Candidatus Woesearchaeota archaeon]